MSTRWYPLYQQGNPQLRIFLPNFWLKLIKPEHNQPKNIVQFHCSMEMTRLDIKNYLEKIYNIHPIHVRTRIALGKTYIPTGIKFVVKEDDVKIAYVTLPKTETFTFPDIVPKEPEDKNEKALNEVEDNFKNFAEKNKTPGFPSWFAT
ncbi:probable 39S ribosomal protein L23, mitochondrial isoform X3 [Bombus pyrosoma]|uniref:probable 39S ribosomal protein L23, mitochondrial isoform X3 n=1 Tax=Bombus pyrosoma TaxID=396416 RepID=UPI001CB8DD30|nr:probable 39S ribosomal protein L23, mitochondrial isoform X3 [Bombus pyrosoma]XP_043588595.1 probable 39S ribosomal protein L23, mitochondrial isoform X3 [Bombus pyrosoma]XP_043588596.1 probable 39S ribosomal protein L23, mitochondrial isoform X3 [Bombus pyrosoma]